MTVVRICFIFASGKEDDASPAGGLDELDESIDRRES